MGELKTAKSAQGKVCASSSRWCLAGWILELEHDVAV